MVFPTWGLSPAGSLGGSAFQKLLSVLEESGELPQVVAEAGGLAFRERGHFLLERRF